MTIISVMGLTTGMVLAFFICSAISVLAMYRVLTNIIEHETDLHDLRNRLKEVQFERELRDAQIRGLVAISNDEPADAVEAVEKAQFAAQQVAEALGDATPAPAQAA